LAGLVCEFGTNLSVFSAKEGPIIGRLMAHEALTAFFLEAGFLKDLPLLAKSRRRRATPPCA
jgi:cytochrome bd-type quinol oxidase subunit 1